MDIEAFLRKVGDVYQSAARNQERNQRAMERKFQDFLRTKSDEEIMNAYRRMDRSKPAFRVLEQEARKRNLV